MVAQSENMATGLPIDWVDLSFATPIYADRGAAMCQMVVRSMRRRFAFVQSPCSGKVSHFAYHLPVIYEYAA